MENNFNENVVGFLKDEEKQLRTRISGCIRTGDFSMYGKFINAYERVVELIKKYDWELKYSEYSTGDVKQIAVWEQNGDRLIRNHKVWEIK